MRKGGNVMKKKITGLLVFMLFIAVTPANPESKEGLVTISDISRFPYTTGIAHVGSLYYVDRTYTITSLTSWLDGLDMIMTANDDKYQTGSIWLSFNVNKDVMIYVAYDSTASSLPDWMTGWYATGLTVGTTDWDYLKWLVVYSKQFKQGQIVLGANDGYSTGAESMYIVFVQGLYTPPEIPEEDTDDVLEPEEDESPDYDPLESH